MDLQDLSIQDIRATVCVADLGHFGRAAAALGVAQPTLSAQVRKVERVLGRVLFERSSRRFLITPDGERLIPAAREILAAVDRLGEAAAAVERSPLRLGVIPTLGPYVMPHLLGAMQREGDGVEITERQTARLVESLLDGVLDAALLSLPLEVDALEFVPLFDEPFLLIAMRGSEMAAVERLVPSRLRAEEMLLLEEGHCLRDQVVAVCPKRAGAAPKTVAASLETLKYLVAAGGGYSLLPVLAGELHGRLGELLAVRAFDEQAPMRRIGVCFRRTMANRERIMRLAELIRANLPKGVVGVAG